MIEQEELKQEDLQAIYKDLLVKSVEILLKFPPDAKADFINELVDMLSNHYKTEVDNLMTQLDSMKCQFADFSKRLSTEAFNKT